MSESSPTTSDAPDDRLVAKLREAERASMFRRLAAGFLLPFRALRFVLAHRSLWPLVIVPALLNIGIFAALIYLLVPNAGTLLSWVWAFPEAAAWWGALLRTLWWVAVVIVALLSLLAAYGFTLLAAGIVASPFNDALSQRAEGLMLGPDRVPTRDEHAIWGILRSIFSSLIILLSYCMVMLPIFAFNLIPFAGQLAASLFSIVVSALFLSLEFTDPPMDRRGFGLREKFEALEDDRAFALGFGVGVAALLWIPLLNFLTIPIAVVGGSALGAVLAERERKRSSRSIPAVDVDLEG